MRNHPPGTILVDGVVVSRKLRPLGRGRVQGVEQSCPADCLEGMIHHGDGEIDDCSVCMGAARWPVFKVAESFGRICGSRFRAHGDHSAEEFRDDHLLPLLEKGPLTIDLTGSLMCASFTEEAFGGLVRKIGVNYSKDIINRLHLVGREEDVREAWGFIHEERARQGVDVDDE